VLVFAHAVSASFEPVQIAPPLIAGIGYAVRARTLARQGRPVRTARRAAFWAGIALILTTLVSPIANAGHELILAHMAQHLLLADIGALLLVLGCTGPVLQPLLGLPVFKQLRVLIHPAVALPLWIFNLYVWHLPPLYQAALSSELVHALQHTAFVAFGVNMWLALLGPLPAPEWFGNGARFLYLVTVRLAGALLGNVFIWSGKVFYPDYRVGQASWHISALNDQGVAGTIMMVESSIITIVILAWLFLKTARDAEERQVLVEFAERHGLELSERRAARAVGAGRGAELRRRLERAASERDMAAVL
jgi:cytochrome c oxidase assembly factor CtaG